MEDMTSVRFMIRFTSYIGAGTFGYPQEKLDFFTRCYLEAKNTGKPYSVEFEGHFVPHCWALLQAVGDEKFLFLVQDITAIKAMEDELRRHKSELEKTVQARTYQLEQAVKVKSRFLAVMSHGRLPSLF